MAGKRVDNPLGLAVLAYLMERPMHPYELGKLLKQRNIQESIKYRHASLYMVVDQLRRAGHIAAQETTREGQRPERTIYHITDAGTVALRARMRDLLAVPAKEYPRFQSALALIAVLPPEEVAELLEQRRHALLQRSEELRTYVERRQDMDQLWLVEHRYQRELVEAELRFVADLQHRIAQGGPRFGAFWRRLHGGDPEAGTGDGA